MAGWTKGVEGFTRAARAKPRTTRRTFDSAKPNTICSRELHASSLCWRLIGHLTQGL